MASTLAPIVPSSSELGLGNNRSPVSFVAASSADRASRSGIWVGIFAITMSFAAFTSALFVRQGTSDWVHLVLPSVLYLNTLFLLASSVTLEISRRSLASATIIESDHARRAKVWLLVTLIFGIAFCAGQYMAWQQLHAAGFYLATNPNSSFFYVLTFVHVLHVLVGVAAIVYLLGRLMASHSTFRRSLFENTAVYWHFIGVLWVYLFLLCLMKL
jgi:cytochrome c oxidase subunit III